MQLGNVGLDPSRVFKVRDAAIDRSAIHITLDDGNIAFTQDVMGRITGAFFEGEGEVLLAPPNEMERQSMSLFTGMAILEERFSSAYFRFNDNTASELQPGLRAPENPQEFVDRWNMTARNLAQVDAMRLLVDFSRMLPVAGEKISANSSAANALDPEDRMLHVRVQGNKLGAFDIFFDSTAGEQVEAGQVKTAENGNVYYDSWTSFSTTPVSPHESKKKRSSREEIPQTVPPEAGSRENPISVRNYVIAATVKPPKELNAEVKLQLDIEHGGSRCLVFELSRFLQIQTVEANGHAVEFIQNPAVEGTRLARTGNDVVAVILPEPARKGQEITLRFVYGGDVLAEAGKGLLYVGERGTWYPNRGLAMADYDLTFHYPAGWTLVATGKPSQISKPPTAPQAEAQNAGMEQVGRWVSERPIPVAGFNLGRYVRAAAPAGNVMVETYATVGVERDFPRPPPPTVPPEPPQLRPGGISPVPLAPTLSSPAVSPAQNAAAVAETTAHAIRYFAERFGPFPYSQLVLTQLPGRESQGWPGLIFLSSYAFMTPKQNEEIHMDPAQALMAQQVPAHEAAHQWWGDLILWNTYRDQWFSEGLANYSALMMLQEKNPAAFQKVMEKYREDLLEKDKDGNFPKDAGPVTLGSRLLSSHFPEGYEAISYGRGTWLFHMLRSMLQDAASEAGRKDSGRSIEEPFLRSLRKLRERYEGKAISTRELLDVFAEDLPPSLRYEGKASLDWFLEGWINGTSLPRLELQAVKFIPKANATVVTGVIRQKNAPEDLVTSVPIYAVTSAKSPVYVGRVFADGAESSFHLTAPLGTHKLLLDPNGTILTSPK
jgi:Peptidase family M1 domain